MARWRLPAIVGSLLAIPSAACGHRPVCELSPRQSYIAVPDTTPPGWITGMVVALPDSAPIAQAQVLVNGGQSFDMTDSVGRFRIVAGFTGTVTVRVQMINYRPVQFQTQLLADRGLHLRIGMVPFCFQVHPVAN